MNYIRLKLLPFDPPRYITLGMAVPEESKLTPAVVKFVEYTRNIIRFRIKPENKKSAD
jgi:hypothetical protein